MAKDRAARLRVRRLHSMVPIGLWLALSVSDAFARLAREAFLQHICRSLDGVLCACERARFCSLATGPHSGQFCWVRLNMGGSPNMEGISPWFAFNCHKQYVFFQGRLG